MPSELNDLQSQLNKYDTETDRLDQKADEFLYSYDLASFRNERDKSIAENGKSSRYGDIVIDKNGQLAEDGDFKKFLKSNYNDFVSTVFGAGDKYQFDVLDSGKKVGTSNKTYDSIGSNSFDDMDTTELVDFYKSAKEDPNAENVAYTYRQYDGKDEDGEDLYNYKVGFAKAGAWDRVKGNFAAQGIELLDEKRFAGAEEWENAFHTKFVSERAVDKGKNRSSGFNYTNGYTEFYGKDLLNADKGQSVKDTYDNMNQSLRDSKEYRSKHTGSDSIIDAVQYGTLRLGSDVLDMAATGVGAVLNAFGATNTLSDNVFDKWSEDAAKNVGYDMQAQTEATTEAVEAWKRGDYFAAVFDDLGAKANTIGESLPERLLMSVGIGAGAAAARLARSAMTIEKEMAGLNIIKDAAKIKQLNSERTAVLNAIKATGADAAAFETLAKQSVMTSLTKTVAKNAGFNAVWAKNTNNIIEERIANGDDDVSIVEFSVIAAFQFILTGLDKIAFDEIVGSKEIMSAFKSAYRAVKGTKAEQSILSKAATMIATTATSIGEEAAQELTQTWGEILGKDVGVNGKTLFESFNDEENKDEALGGSIMGAAAGGITHVAGKATEGSLSLAGKIYAKLSEDGENLSKNDKQAGYKKVGEVAKKLSDGISSIMSDTMESVGKPRAIKEKMEEAIDMFGEGLDEHGKRKIANEAIAAVRLSDNPRTVKVDILTSIFESDKFTEEEKDALNDRFTQDALKDVADTYKAHTKGSKTDSAKHDDDYNLKDEPESTPPPSSGNPVKGLLGPIIESLEAQKIVAEKNGLSTTDLTKAIAVVTAYNTSDIFEKSLDSVSSEVDIIGFVGDNGDITKPSIQSYATYMPEMIASDESGFADLDSFHTFSTQRTNKLDMNRIGVYNLINAMNVENMKMANMADRMLNSGMEMTEEQRATLISARDNFAKATLINTNGFIATRKKRSLDVDKMTPEEEATVIEKATAVKTQAEAIALLLTLDKNFSSPDAADKFMKMYQSVIAGKGNELTGSGVSSKTVQEMLKEIKNGTHDIEEIKTIQNQQNDISDTDREYLMHVAESNGLPYAESIEGELLASIDSANSVEEIAGTMSTVLSSFMLSNSAFKTLRDTAEKRIQDLNAPKLKSLETMVDELNQSKYSTDAKQYYLDNKDSIDALDAESKKVFLDTIAKVIRKLIPSEKREKELIAAEEAGIEKKKQGKQEEEYNEYDTRTIDQEIKELESLKNKIESMDSKNKDLSDADKVVFKNVQNSIKKEINKVEKSIEKYENAKAKREQKQKEQEGKSEELNDNPNQRDESWINAIETVAKAIKAFKASIKRIMKILTRLKKDKKSFEKIHDAISSYVDKGKVDLRQRAAAVKAVDTAIAEKKAKKDNIKKELKKETEESLRKKLKVDSIEAEFGMDTSSLRSSIKNKMIALANIYISQMKKIYDKISKEKEKLKRAEGRISIAENWRTRTEKAYDNMLERYNESKNKHTESIDKLKDKIKSEKQFVHDLIMEAKVLSARKSRNEISDTEYDRSKKRIQKFVKSHEDNIVKFNGFISEQEDAFGTKEESFIDKLRKISTKLNDDRDGTKQRQRILELEEQKIKIENKMKDVVYKNKKELTLYNDTASVILSDLAKVEFTGSLDISSTLENEKFNPNDHLKNEKGNGENIIEETKDSNLKKFVQAKRTILSTLTNLFDASKIKIRALVDRYDLAEGTEEAIAFYSRFIKKMPEVKLVTSKSNASTVDEDGKLVGFSDDGWIRMMNLFGVDNSKLKEAISFGAASMIFAEKDVRSKIANMDNKDIAKDFGISNGSEGEFKKLVMQGFTPISTLRAEVYSLVMDRLGIKLSNDLPIETINMIEAGIKAAVDAQFRATIMNGKDFDSSENAITETMTGKSMKMVRLDYKELGLEEGYQKHYSRISYMNSNGKRRPPSREPYELKEDETIINSFVPLNDKHRTDVERSNNIEYFFSDKIADFESAYKKNKKEALKRFGYVELNDNMHVEEQMHQKALNDKIEREAELLLEYYNQFRNEDGSTDSFYVPHGVTKSERMNIRSDINIQESKIHRAFVYSKDYRSAMITGSDSKRDVLDMKSDSLSNAEMFEIALAQAFGMDPDKNGLIQVMRGLREKINIYGDKVEIIDTESKEWLALHDYINGIGDDNDNLAILFHEFDGMHTVMAAMELRELFRTGANKSFETILYLEADGITSGPALLNMKVLGEHQLLMLEKAGVYTEEGLKKWTEYTKFLLAKKHNVSEDQIEFTPGALIEAGKYHMKLNDGDIEFDQNGSPVPKSIDINGKKMFPFLDLYTTVGQFANNEKYKFENEVDNKGKTAFDKMSKVAKALYKRVFKENSLKELRSISKDPTMTSGYGAMINSIKRTLSYNTYGKELINITVESKSTDAIYRAIVDLETKKITREERNKAEDNGVDVTYEMYESIKKEAQKKAKEKAKDYLSDLNNFGIYNEELETFIEPTIEQYNEMVQQGTLYNHITLSHGLLQDIYNEYSKNNIGAFYEHALDEAFGDVSIMRNAMKSIDLMVSGIFNAKLKVRLDKIKNENGFVTKKQYFEELLKLHLEGNGHSLDNGVTKQPLYKTEGTAEDSTRRALETVEANGVKYSVSVTPQGIEFTDNTGAAVTISIHSLDGSVMQKALSKNDFTNIYDAVVAGVGQKKLNEATTTYNKEWVKGSLERQDFKLYHEKLDRMLASMTKEEADIFYNNTVRYEYVGSSEPVAMNPYNIDKVPMYATRKVGDKYEIQRYGRAPAGRVEITHSQDAKVMDVKIYTSNGQLMMRAEIVTDENGVSKARINTFISKAKAEKDGTYPVTEMKEVFTGIVDTSMDPVEQLAQIVDNAIEKNKPYYKNTDMNTGNELTKITSVNVSARETNDLSLTGSWGFIGVTPTTLISKIREGVNVVNNGVEHFNNTVDKLYSAQMFVTGTGIEEVNLKHTELRPKQIDNMSEEANAMIGGFKQRYGQDLKKWLTVELKNRQIDEEVAIRFMNEIDFDTLTISSQAMLILPNMHDNLIENGMVSADINNTKGKTKPTDTLKEKFNGYFNDKTKGCS